MSKYTREPLQPTAPGLIGGVISKDPLRIQCQECGNVQDWQTLGLKPEQSGRAIVVLLSDILFCRGGHVRRCHDCRKRRGYCYSCPETYSNHRGD